MFATHRILSGLVLVAACATAAAQSTQIASIGPSGVPGNNNSEEPMMSADGRFVLFRSVASNLAHADADVTQDAYLRDLLNGTLELVSINSNGDHAAGVNLAESLSADGSLVCFRSDAANLAANDTGNDFDIFVRDRVHGTTTIVSVDSSGVHGNGDSDVGVISGDGRFVAFRSQASNLVANDTNNEWDVFVHDLQSGTTERVNLGPGNAQAHGDSYVTSLSFDGRFVLFSSLATDLVPNDTNNERDIFVRDRLLATTRRISVDSQGVQSNGDSHARYLSSDGRFAIYVSLADDLVPSDTNGVQDVFVHELATGMTTRASVSSGGGQSDGPTDANSISADGRFVAMFSTATNLVPGDAGLSDVFVHDRWSGQTTRVGLAASGAAPDADSFGGTLSADGRYVAFFTGAGNMVPGVAGGSTQVYVRDRGPASPFAPLCAGDAGSPCPCGNHSPAGANEGCLNSLGLGGRLVATGTASLMTDTLVLSGDLMPDAACLYFQGTNVQSNGHGSAFGDGLRCASGTITRLGASSNVSGASHYPGSGSAPVAVQGGVSAPGVRIYQAWYRNAASFCTPSTFNLTNGVWVLWTT